MSKVTFDVAIDAPEILLPLSKQEALELVILLGATQRYWTLTDSLVCLRLKKLLADEIPPWVQSLDHAAAQSLMLFCSCGASHSATVGASSLAKAFPACPSCGRTERAPHNARRTGAY